MKSIFFSLNLKDLTKGFVVAFITVLIATIGQTLDSGALPTFAALKVASLTGVAAGLAYVLKNLFTNSADKFLAKE